MTRMKKLYTILLCCICGMSIPSKATTIAENPASHPAQAAAMDDDTFTSIDWGFETIKTDSTGAYYLYNLSDRLFLNDDNTLGNTPQTLWTVYGKQISSQNGKYLSLTSQNEGSLFQPNWVFTASSGSEKAAIALLESVDDAYYVIGNNVNINTLQRQARYLTAVDGMLGVTPGKEVTEQAQWLFISIEQYEQKTADIDIDAWERTQAIEALSQAIEAAEQLQATMEVAPMGCKTALQTAISTAKVMKSSLDRGGIIARLITTKQIVDAAQSLEGTVAQMQGVPDYYVGVKQEIDSVELISSSTALKAIVAAARSGVELSTNVSGMNTAVNTMHYALVGYLQGVESLEERQSLTGMLSNPSFERGNMDGWTGLDVDLQQIDITHISLDNLGMLAKAIKIGMREGTQAVTYTDEEREETVPSKFYLHSDNEGTLAGQPVAQILMGMPAGSYQLSARMAVNPGLLRTNSCHLTVLTIPNEALQEVLGNIDISNLGNLAEAIDLSTVLPIMLEKGQLVSNKNAGANLSTWVDVTLDFDIQKNDIVVMVMNGGLYPLLATSAYKADDIQLHYLHAPIVDPEEGTGEEDSINRLSPSSAAHPAYDLSGRPAHGQKRGLVIRDGRKICPLTPCF